MPIDAAQPFETEHASRAAGKRMVIESLLIQFEQAFPGAVQFLAVLVAQSGDAGHEIVDVPEVAVEAIRSVGILQDNALVTVIEHPHKERKGADLTGRDPVLLEVVRQFPVRVQHESVLVRPVKIAFEQRVEHADGLFRAHGTGTQGRDLAFQHRVKRTYLCLVGGDAEEVIGMIETIAAPVGRDGVVDRCEGIVEHRENLLRRDLDRARKAFLPIDRLAIATGGLAELLERAESLLRAYRAFAEQGPGRRQRLCRFPEPVPDLGRQRYRVRLVREQALHEVNVAPHVAECHHRQPVSDDRVVCVIPFRTLCVQPDAAVNDEIAQLGQ